MQPLAYRMRPKNLDEVVGQEHLVGNKKIIRRMVEAKLLSSMILYGPPGIGKTSIASAIAGSTKYAFRKLNAATDTKKDLQIVAEEGKMSGTVILLLDEIHRLDKTKQDFLLPLLESGNIILIGATTENPYISISPAIRSRCQIFELHRLKEMDISHAIDRALKDSETGLGKYNVELTKDARNLLIEKGNGDLRATLNALELAVLSTKEEKQENADNKLVIDKAEMQDSIQFKSQNYDANGDGHYDLLSAFQKSIRGSDTDAALYYLGNLCESGDLVAICRRLLVIAYEDIGLARDQLITYLYNYLPYLEHDIWVVFDGYQVKGNIGTTLHKKGLTIIYTKADQTADAYLEKSAYDLKNQYRVTYATSDALIQNAVFSQGALRMSAKELESRLILKNVILK